MTGLSDVIARTALDWVEPLSAAAGLSRREGLACLLSNGTTPGRRSFVAIEPDLTQRHDIGAGPVFDVLNDPAWSRHVVGVASYDAGARPATGERETIWPDLMLARYAAMLVFDHDARRVTAVGLGPDTASAAGARDRAVGWIETATSPACVAAPSSAFVAETSDADYRDAVADVVSRIAEGELFQANIARAWHGVLVAEADPFDVFARLAMGYGAPYAAFWRMGERVVVSNSPELFLTWDPLADRVETRPIKGTRGRAADPIADAAAAQALLDSAKDRAENLMIVDLMRNDLARVCVAGSVKVEALFAIETHPGLHHLVSTVSGRPTPGTRSADLLEATFPPGSITGAPKHQAMKVISGHERPRGAWCGTLLVLDDRGGMTASVLIRTASFERTDGLWRWRALAGAGIVADSDPASELAETDLKIAALRAALCG